MTLPLTVLAVGVGALAAGSLLVAHRRGAVGHAAIGRGVGALILLAASATAVVLGFVVSGRIRGFGLMHHAYLVGTVSAPMVGVAAAWVAWRRGTGALARIAAVVLLLPAPVGFYATHVEPHWLRVDRVTVAVDPARAGDDPVTIGVLADLQTNRVGSHERAAVRRLMDAAPDIILMPGDLFHGNDEEYTRELDAMRSLLAELEAPHGVYFVQGDADPPRWVDRMLEGTDIVVLDRDVVAVQVGDRRLRIGGHTLHPSGHDADVVRTALQQTAAPEEITILVAHRPDTVLYLEPGSRVDLTVAGHTHGGQIVVPGIGPLVTLSDVPRHVARGGLHRVDGNQIYVSPGVGLERGDAPQVRIFSRPAVAILTLI